GEMQALATGVGDLKKVLSNIKVRGTWGEIQLGNLLEQILAPNQYEQNVATKPSAPGNRVEFAIKLPGKDNSTVWLPIDSKFPLADYQALLDARDKNDIEAAELAMRALEKRIKAEAKDIRDKYLEPPFTTDFAILFLPVEGLYSEILAHYELCEQLQNDFRVTIAGPTTLTAILNSLQMGFRTLAIEQRSQEVWHLLEAVRTSFDQFGLALEKTQKKLNEASRSIDEASAKTRKISRQLKNVGELPADEAERLLQLGQINFEKEQEEF
ncbi:MAG: DNA recombination protein RmuC, partial [Firmicutes bacterium]|nr:DNA recombination protein RmuC [Bacillota bacterium]